MDATSPQGSSAQSFGRQEQGRPDQGRAEPWREAEGQSLHGTSSQPGGIRDSVDSFVSRGKEQVAGQVDAAARALHNAAGDLEREQPQAARLTHSVAGQIDRASMYLRNLEPRQVLGDIEAFARREPAMFIAGAALAGVVLGRFLRASGSRAGSDRYSYVGPERARGTNHPTERIGGGGLSSGGPIGSVGGAGGAGLPGTLGGA